MVIYQKYESTVYLSGLHYNKRQVRETLKCRNKIGSMLVRRKSSAKAIR